MTQTSEHFWIIAPGQACLLFQAAANAHKAWETGDKPTIDATMGTLKEAIDFCAESDARSRAASTLTEIAREAHHRDGELEIDDNPVVSVSDDKGAYIAAWVWIDNPDCRDCGETVEDADNDYCNTCLDKTGGEDAPE
jgi:hypothetical protein